MARLPNKFDLGPAVPAKAQKWRQRIWEAPGAANISRVANMQERAGNARGAALDKLGSGISSFASDVGAAEHKNALYEEGLAKKAHAKAKAAGEAKRDYELIRRHSENQHKLGLNLDEGRRNAGRDTLATHTQTELEHYDTVNGEAFREAKKAGWSEGRLFKYEQNLLEGRRKLERNSIEWVNKRGAEYANADLDVNFNDNHARGVTSENVEDKVRAHNAEVQNNPWLSQPEKDERIINGEKELARILLGNVPPKRAMAWALKPDSHGAPAILGRLDETERLKLVPVAKARQDMLLGTIRTGIAEANDLIARNGTPDIQFMGVLANQVNEADDKALKDEFAVLMARVEARTGDYKTFGERYEAARKKESDWRAKQGGKLTKQQDRETKATYAVIAQDAKLQNDNPILWARQNAGSGYTIEPFNVSDKKDRTARLAERINQADSIHRVHGGTHKIFEPYEAEGIAKAIQQGDEGLIHDITALPPRQQQRVMKEVFQNSDPRIGGAIGFHVNVAVNAGKDSTIFQDAALGMRQNFPGNKEAKNARERALKYTHDKIQERKSALRTFTDGMEIPPGQFDGLAAYIDHVVEGRYTRTGEILEVDQDLVDQVLGKVQKNGKILGGSEIHMGRRTTTPPWIENGQLTDVIQAIEPEMLKNLGWPMSFRGGMHRRLTHEDIMLSPLVPAGPGRFYIYEGKGTDGKPRYYMNERDGGKSFFVLDFREPLLRSYLEKHPAWKKDSNALR